jgi:hypothetical protein
LVPLPLLLLVETSESPLTLASEWLTRRTRTPQRRSWVSSIVEWGIWDLGVRRRECEAD